jgi:HK97 family phage prohead protease
VEKRTFNLSELRAVDEANPRLLRGTAVVYEQPADMGGEWAEIISPGALTRSLASTRDIKARYEHEALLASSSNRTLVLKDGPRGLGVEIDVAKTTTGDDVLELVGRGDIKGMSFGFIVPPGGSRWSRDSGKLTRTITDLDLHEVTVTDNPVYTGTTVALRSISAALLAEAKQQLDEITPPTATLAERRRQLQRQRSAC